MKHLFIFDTKTQRIIAKHYFWNEEWDIKSNWKTFAPDTNVALIVDSSIPEFDEKGYIIQPSSFSEPETVQFIYTDPNKLPPNKLPKIKQDQEQKK